MKYFTFFITIFLSCHTATPNNFFNDIKNTKKTIEYFAHNEFTKGINLLQNIKDKTIFKSHLFFNELYDLSPSNIKHNLVDIFIDNGFLGAEFLNRCAFFKMNIRVQTAQTIQKLLNDEHVTIKQKKLLEKILLITLAETNNNEDEEVLTTYTTDDLLERINILLSFGQNKKAIKIYDLIKKSRSLSNNERCKCDYVYAKTLKNLREFSKCMPILQNIATSCKREESMKAKFLSLQISSIKGDYKNFDDFDAFALSYPDSGLSDDILMMKASLLKDSEQQIDTLQNIIKQFPKGDMYDKALFLLGFLALKKGLTYKAILYFDELGKKAAENSLEKSQSLYWIARSIVFNDMANFALKKDLSKKEIILIKQSLKALFEQTPNVYTFLAQNIFPYEFLPQKHTLSPRKKNQLVIKNKFLLQINKAIDKGYASVAQKILPFIDTQFFNLSDKAYVATLYKKSNIENMSLINIFSCPHVAYSHEKMFYPTIFKQEILYAAKKIKINPSLIFAIAKEESIFLENARSYRGALGIMQLMPESALSEAKKLKIKIADEQDILNVGNNALLGSSLLMNYIRMFDNIILGVAAYNAGPTSVKRFIKQSEFNSIDSFIETLPYEATKGYVKRVVSSMINYDLLYQLDFNDRNYFKKSY